MSWTETLKIHSFLIKSIQSVSLSTTCMSGSSGSKQKKVIVSCWWIFFLLYVWLWNKFMVKIEMKYQLDVIMWAS